VEYDAAWNLPDASDAGRIEDLLAAAP
jgi:hypothetical protein